MAYTTAGGGGYGTGASVIHGDSSHSDYISVPDAELLFRGDFHRAGPDLILTGQDGRHYIIPDYFSGETHPALMAPNGATLSPDLVDLLAGSPTPGQYAQAQATTPADAIGKVEKVVGNVTVMRNGVSVALHVGDAVFKSDVIQTGANSSCGVGFPDGTVLDLVANTRMALNEYTFDPDGHSNSALFSLVEGTFAFVAGKVAHTGDMKIATPVATMGIRGTVGLVKKEISTFSANLGEVIYSILLHEDMDGSHHLGRIAVIDRDPTSPTFGEVIFIIADSSYVTYVMPQGPGLPPIVTTEPITDSRLFDDQHIFDDLGQILNYLLNGTNPQSNPSPGSGDNPNGLLPQYFQENNGAPFNINLPFNGPFGPGFGPTITIITFNTPPNPGATNTPLPPPAPPPPAGSDVFIWPIGDNFWDTPGSWNPNSVPVGPGDTVEILAGTVTYPATDFYTIKFLYLAPGAILDIIGIGGIGGIGGSLTVLNGVDDYGAIIVGGDPPTLAISGPVTVESGGKIEAHDGTVSFAGGTVTVDPASTNEPAGRIVSRGHGSTVEFTNDILNNFGIVAAEHHGSISFSHTSITNDGVIKATHRGDITLANSSLTNESGGIVEAKHRGTINIDNTDVFNDAGAIIAAIGRGSRVELLDGNVKDNSGTILAANFGTVFLSSTPVTNGTGGLFLAEDGGRIVFDSSDITNDGKILSVGCDSLIVLKDNELDNSDIVAARDGGTIKFHGEQVTNEIGAKIVADDGTMVFAGGGVTNGGKIEADHGGEIVFASINGNPIAVTNSITNAITNVTTGGTIKATDYGTIAFFGHGGGAVDNDYGLMEATNHGTLIFDDIAVNNSDGGMIEATHAGTVIIEGNGGPAVTDGGGTIAAIGRGSIVDIVDGAVIAGDINNPDGSFTAATATLEAAYGGTIFVSRGSTLEGSVNVDISGGGLADFADVLNQNATVTVAFSGPGTLQLDQTLSSQESAAPVTVSGFGIGDTIDLTNLKFSTNESVEYLTVSGNVLTITDDGTSESFTLTGGTYNQSQFTLLMDPSGGTEVVYGLQDRWTDPCGGCWTACGDWCDGVPTACSTAIIELPVTVRLYTCAVVGNLVIGACATLDIGDCGSLTVLNALDDGGRILVESTGKDPTLLVDGPVTVERSGEIEARGWLSNVEFFQDRVGNFGVIVALHGGTVLFDGSTIWNERDGKIEATHDGTVIFKDATVTNEFGAQIEAKDHGTVLFADGSLDNEYRAAVVAEGFGSKVRFFDEDVYNASLIAATWGGAVLFDYSSIENAWGGTIVADGRWSTVAFAHDAIDNAARIAAERGGEVSFYASQIDNEYCGTIGADGFRSEVSFAYATVDNLGLIGAKNGGEVSFSGSQIDNEYSGTIGAEGRWSNIGFFGDHIDNAGSIGALWGGTVLFAYSSIDNAWSGTIAADGWGSEVTFFRDYVYNSGRIVADHGGQVSFNETHVDNEFSGKIEAIGWGSTVEFDHDRVDNAGLIEAKYRGTVLLDHTHVDNNGTIEALGWNSTVDIDHSTIVGGTLLADGGKIVVDHSHLSDAVNVAITGGGIVDFKGNLKSDVDITFGVDGQPGAGTLELHNVANGAIVTINDFGTDDVLDLRNVPIGSAAPLWNADTLTIGGESVTFDGTYNPSDFALLSDPWGGTEVVYGLAVDVWSGDGDGTSWDEAANWGGGAVPGPQDTAEIFTTSGAIVVNDPETVANLLIGESASLDIDGGGSLTVTNALEVSGLVEVVDSGSTLQVYGPVRVDSGGEIEATESGAVVTFYDDQVGNAGTIAASDHGVVLFDGADVWNENGGTIEASQHGKVVFAGGTLDNGPGAAVVAEGSGSKVKFFREDVDNWGSIAATCGAVVLFDHAVVDNNTVFVKGGPPGIGAEDGGTITFKNSTILNSSGSLIASQDGGLIAFDYSLVDNEHHGKIEADGCGSTVKFDHDIVDNSGRIEAKDGGTVWIDHSIVDNWGGTIAAVGCDTTVDLSHATIIGGTLETKRGGLIETVHGNTTFDDVTVINKGSIDVDYESNVSTLTLQNGTSVTGGSMVIGCDGILAIEGCAGATLDDVSVCNLNLIQVDSESTASTLYLTNGTSITGGMLWIGCLGAVDVEGSGATLDGVTVNNNNVIEVGETADSIVKLKLDGTTIEGGTLATGGDPYGDAYGVIRVIGSDTTTFDGLDNGLLTVSGYVQVAPKSELELQGTIKLDGNVDGLGVIEVDQSTNGKHGGTVVIDNTVMLKGDGYIALEGDNTGIVGDACDGGTLINDSYIYGARGGYIGNGDDSLTFTNHSWVIVEDGAAAPLVINTGDNPVTNTGTLEASGYSNTDHSELDLYGIYDNNKGTILATDGGLVEFFGATVKNGTLTIDMTVDTSGVTPVNINSEVDIEAASGGLTTTFNNVTVTDDGIIQIDTPNNTATLLLTGGTTITGDTCDTDELLIGTNGTLDVEGTDGAKLDNIDVQITGDGSIEVGESEAATLVLEDGTTVSGGSLAVGEGSFVTIEAGSGVNGNGATFDGVMATVDGTIQVDISDNSATLLLTGGTTISGDSGDTDQLLINSNGTLDVEHNTGSAPDATLDGLLVTDDNTSTGTAAGITIATGSAAATLLVDDGTVVSGGGTGTMTIGVNGTLDIEHKTGSGPDATLDGVLVTDDNISTGTVAGITVDKPASTAATLLVDDGTVISGGGTGTMTIGTKGTLDVEQGTSGPGATLDGVLVTDDNTGTKTQGITVGATSTATLTLDDGTTITGGTLSIGSTGTLDAFQGTIPQPNGYDATLDGVTVNIADGGSIEIGPQNLSNWAVFLVEGDSTITGGAIDINFGSLTLNNASLTDTTLTNEQSYTALYIDGVGATFDNVAMTNNGLIYVYGGLVLENGTNITDGSSASITVGSAGPDGDTGASLTLNDATLTGGDSSGDLTNYGTVYIDGVGGTFDGVTVTNDGAFTVYGNLTLDQGTTVTNSTSSPVGSITLSGSGSSLTLNDATITNGDLVDGGTVYVDGSGAEFDGVAASGSGAYTLYDVLTLVDGASITGGTMTMGAFGEVNVLAGTNDSGATFDGLAVTTNNVIDVNATATSGSVIALNLEDGATITGGDMTIGAYGQVNVVAGLGGGAGATFDDLAVTNGNAIDVNATATSGPTVTLKLDDNTSITGGSMTIGAYGALAIEPGTNGDGATLDDVKVTNNGTITVDKVTTAILTIDDNTSITGGSLQINSKGTLDVVANSNSNGATLDDVNVTDSNAINVNTLATSGSVVTLTLDDGTVIAGGGDLTIGTYGKLDIEYGANGPGATLDGITVTNGNEIDVDFTPPPVSPTVVLTLDDGTSIAGGSMNIGSSGEVNVIAGSGGGAGATFDDLTVINGNAIDVNATATSGPTVTLTLDDNTSITGGSMTIGTYGALAIEPSKNGDGATLDDVTVTNHGAITVDKVSTATFTVDDGTTITDGTLTINSKGTLDVGTGNEAHGDGATLYGVAVTDDNVITVDSGAVLSLDADTSSVATTITMNSANAEIIGLGTIDNYGTISGYGTINVATLNNETGGVVNANVSGEALTIEDVVNGTGMVEIQGGTLEFTVAETGLAVTFNNTNSLGGTTYGELILSSTSDYSVGDISGFSGLDSSSPSLSNTDEVELLGFKAKSMTETAEGGGVEQVVLTDKNGATVTLDFLNPGGTIKFMTTGSNTIVYDPPTGDSSPSVSLNNDSFTFHSGSNSGGSNMPASTPQGGQFTPTEIQQWLAGGSDGHADAFVDFAHHDDGAGTSAHWHALVQNAVHLH